MGYFKFFILGIVCIFISMLTACSNKETLGDVAGTVLASKNIDNVKENSINDNTKRGMFSWLNSKEEKVNEKVKEDYQNNLTSQPKIIDNSIQEEPVIDLPSEKEQEPNKIKKSSVLSFNIFKSWFNKAKGLVSEVDLEKLDIPYKENTISNRKGLYFVVLRVPESEELNTKVDELNSKTVESEDALKLNNIKDEQVFYDFNLKNNSKDINSNNISLNSNLEAQKVYKDYVYNLRYRDLFFNKNNTFTPSENLISLHQNLINELLSTNVTTPSVLYVIYRNVNDIKDNSSIKNQLLLFNYLNKIRSFTYNKGLRKVFVQEVKLTDLPINQVLLVLKPITKEQFDMLPHQTNLYNSSKISSKEWLNKITAIDEKAKQKQKSLYKQASGS